MLDIKPFCGILYNPARAHLADVVAPPYDVISPQQQAELYDASQFNVVRLDFGREKDRYTSAARYFAQWRKEQILIQGEAPSMYVLIQSFASGEGKMLERCGFIALCRLEEFGSGTILPHEKTLSKPKEDRFRLLQATHAHFSQIFVLYADQEHLIDAILEKARHTAAALDVTFEGVRNRLWKLHDWAEIERLQDMMRTKKILVADGHHRYETALQHRDMMRKNNPKRTGDELYNFITMYFTNMHDEGLVILPTHRLLHSLSNFNQSEFLQKLELYFRLAPQSTLDQLVKNLLGIHPLGKGRKRWAFGVILPHAPQYVLVWLDDLTNVRSQTNSTIVDVVRELDVTILHKLVFEKLLGISPEAQEQKRNLDYVKDIDGALHAVQEGKAQAAFLMNPTLIEQVRAVAEAGYTMPQKSTYFYPKLLSGLVIYSIDEDQ